MSAHNQVKLLLHARRWALAALSREPLPQEIPTMSAGDWDLFLALERCGALLLSRLGTSLPSPAGDRLRMAAATELATVRTAIHADRHSAELGALLELSLDVAQRVSPRDPFAHEAAAFYASVVMKSTITSPAARAFTMEIALGRSTKREAFARALEFRGSGHESIERHLPVPRTPPTTASSQPSVFPGSV